MNNEEAKPDPSNGSTERVEKVREAIGKLVSSEDPAVVQGSASDDPAEVAAQKRLAEIERHVGELVGDPALEGDGRAREG